MSPVSCSCGSVRPSAVVNQHMRALSVGRSRPEDWTAEDLAELAALRAEYLRAVAREQLTQAA